MILLYYIKYCNTIYELTAEADRKRPIAPWLYNIYMMMMMMMGKTRNRINARRGRVWPQNSLGRWYFAPLIGTF